MHPHVPSRLERIEVRLPLAIAALLLIVVAVFSWAAYREVRESALRGAGDRLHDVGGQLGSLLSQSVDQRIAETEQAASDAAVVAAAAGADGVDSAAAQNALDALLESSAQVRAVTLWDIEGTRTLEARRDPAEPDTLGLAASPLPAWDEDERAAVSGFRTSGDVMWYDVAVPVRDGDGAPAGYLVQQRQLASSPEAVRMITELIGSDATFIVGQPGGTWTDLTGVVTDPPPAPPEELARYQRADGSWVLGAGVPVADTPWRVWVEFPLSVVLARPRAFLGRIVPLGLLIVFAGAAGGWVLSRRITEPLGQMTRAASALAAGDYDRRVEADGEDEVAELGRAFNSMAGSLQEALHTARQSESEVRALNARLEERVAERTAELQATNRELEAFSYSVSHDLRAPLRSIHGFSQAVLEDYQDKLDATGVDYLGRVCAAANHMGVLIDDLLELSRATRAEMRRERVDLSRLAEQVLGDLAAEDPERRTDVRIDAGLACAGDQGLLSLVVRNLLDNAWKFTRTRDPAVIEVGATNGSEPAFFVRDNGAGFDMDYADQLFHPFQRLHSLRDFEGTGIGLALVQRIVHRHGGRVWAEGEPDRGATFYFSLPSA